MAVLEQSLHPWWVHQHLCWQHRDRDRLQRRGEETGQVAPRLSFETKPFSLKGKSCARHTNSLFEASWLQSFGTRRWGGGGSMGRHGETEAEQEINQTYSSSIKRRRRHKSFDFSLKSDCVCIYFSSHKGLFQTNSDTWPNILLAADVKVVLFIYSQIHRSLVWLQCLLSIFGSRGDTLFHLWLMINAKYVLNMTPLNLQLHFDHQSLPKVWLSLCVSWDSLRPPGV